ncbi:MAG: UbiA family prenyltransferase [Candidatus Undinarchaeales archaeon]|jgi:geranylgeranylglycerol-phosphate geranylgeranyltransferase|nr:UbiA family prenyltransferase [Candidatus Undinarchaeales archaeon]
MGLKPLFEMTRPKAVLAGIIGIVSAVFLTGADQMLLLPAVMTIAFLTSAGNVINDYYDLKIDKVNRPDRPIPSGRVSLKGAKIFATVLFFIGIMASLSLTPLCILIAFINTFLLLIYAGLFKRSGFLGNIIVGGMVGSVFIFGAVLNGSLITGIMLAVLVFFVASAREVLKDLGDIRGDRAGGAKTLPINRGIRKSKMIIVSFLVLFMLSSPLPYLAGLLPIAYLIVIVAADFLFARVIFNLFRKSSVKIPW